MATIHSITFIRPIAPANGVDGTVPFITSADAKLELVRGDAFVRIAWKGAKDLYQLVPITNVRDMHCAEPQAEPAQKPSTPAPQPQHNPKAKAR